MSKIMLIGADGQLGTDIYKVFKEKNEVVCLVHKNFDITEFKKVKSTLKRIKPQIIINTAAYHKVDEIETNTEKAFLVNAFSQKNLSQIANDIKSTIVFISTDYVYGKDLKRKKPYAESDATGPVNTYGVSKIAGEELTRIYSKKYFIIRTSGLFGANQSTEKGDNFIERTIKLSKEKNEINVVDDQVLSPTYTANLAQNMYELLKTQNYGTYHMVSEGSCSWWQFTKEIFSLLSIKTKCNPVSSDFFKTIAKRPNYSSLANTNLNKINLNKMNHWKINLKEYLKEKGYLNSNS